MMKMKVLAEAIP